MVGLCDNYLFPLISKNVKHKLLRDNVLMGVNTILVVLMVFIAACARRSRHHRWTHFIFLGATTLFLPIVSYVVSAVNSENTVAITKEYIKEYKGTITADCDPRDHITLILLWTGLVKIVGINTTAIAASDAREGRNVGPSVVLLVQAGWTSYLAIYQLVGHHANYEHKFGRTILEGQWMVVPLFTLVFAKLILNYFAWHKARQSLMLGQSPRFMVGYMKVQSQDDMRVQSQDAEVANGTPQLVVGGEDTVLVDQRTHGYTFDRSCMKGLVTLDRVYMELNDSLGSDVTDVCLSFSLFKLLRCRFARYTVVECSFKKARKYLWNISLKDHKRLLGVIECELSFLHDYYYSSLPVSYSKSLLPIFSMFISLISIVNTIVTCCYLVFPTEHMKRGRLFCIWICNSGDQTIPFQWGSLYFGHLYLDIVPVLLLSTLVIFTEMTEIVSYIFSNWTKVVLICSRVRHASWQQSPIIGKYVGHVVRHKCKLFRHRWNKMNQCSVLVLHTKKNPVALLRPLLGLPDQNRKVPTEVETAILKALRSYENCRSNDGVIYLSRILQLKVGDKVIGNFSGANGIVVTMLECHIATSIFEVRSGSCEHPSEDRVAAIHLSCYCAYLVAYHPELLPDDYKMCKSLYKAVKKDAGRLAGCFPGETAKGKCQKLVNLLLSRSEARSKHEVLNRGAKLGSDLAAEVLGKNETELKIAEEKVWEALAGFWSEMILYVAPSTNMDGHAKAIAQGGELITLLGAAHPPLHGHHP